MRIVSQFLKGWHKDVEDPGEKSVFLVLKASSRGSVGRSLL